MIIRKQILNCILDNKSYIKICVRSRPQARTFSSRIDASRILLNQMASPVVKVKQGELRGLAALNQLGETYFKFLGIPYAEPPRRFQEAQPPNSWEGIRDATQENDGCYSRCFITRQIIGSEDCLYLNVYTKELSNKDSNLKPVMVWFYGGAYITGNGKTNMYGPDFLLTEDIVLITLNHRIGIIGFLNYDDNPIPASRNLGLKDQRLALKWIRENIQNFGGDPGNVTIFGVSAGASSSHYHILSKDSKGLFHKAILQSGCALSIFGTGDTNLMRIVEEMGYTVDDEKKAYDVLVKAPIEEIFEAQEKLSKFRLPSAKRLVGPVLEPGNTPSPITTRPTVDIIKEYEYNDVPCIFGYNANEGLFTNVDNLITSMEENNLGYEHFLPRHMNIEEGSELAKKLGSLIKEKYVGEGDDIRAGLQRLLTDCVYVIWIIASIKQHAATSKHSIYAYKMTLDTSLNFTKQLGLVKIKGVCHTDELGYLFKNLKTPHIDENTIEDISWRRLVKLWTNFAKYGNPTPNVEHIGFLWQAVNDPEKIGTMILGEKMEMEVNPDDETVEFWRKILNHSPNTANLL